MNALVLQGRTPAGQLVPIRVDDLGRIEFSQVAATDQALPTQAISLAAGVVTTNPTRPTLLAQVLLTGSDATLYTAAANWRDVVIYIKNVDTVARTCNLALNSTYTDTTAIVKTLPLEVGCRVAVCLPALATGQLIRGLCSSASAASVEIWGTAA